MSDGYFCESCGVLLLRSIKSDEADWTLDLCDSCTSAALQIDKQTIHVKQD